MTVFYCVVNNKGVVHVSILILFMVKSRVEIKQRGVPGTI